MTNTIRRTIGIESTQLGNVAHLAPRPAAPEPPAQVLADLAAAAAAAGGRVDREEGARVVVVGGRAAREAAAGVWKRWADTA